MDKLFLELYKDTLLAPVTVLLLLVTLTGSVIGFYRPVFRQYCTLHPYSVWRSKGLHTVLTAGFVHRTWGHMAMNALLIFYFPGFLEEILVHSAGSAGHIHIFLIYILSVAGGNIGSACWHRHQFAFTSIGASSALFGCLAALLWTVRDAQPFVVIPSMRDITNLHLYGYMMAVLLIVMLVFRHSKYDHAAHFFSAFTGGMLSWLMA